jgi:hypothetical protein
MNSIRNDLSYLNTNAISATTNAGSSGAGSDDTLSSADYYPSKKKKKMDDSYDLPFPKKSGIGAPSNGQHLTDKT